MDLMGGQIDIAVVGGGAAGLAAAVAAGEALRERGGRVVVCEASDRVGRSILATGNGRCNFSNARLTGDGLCDASALDPFYHNAEFVAQVFAALEELPLVERGAAEQAPSFSNAVLRFFADFGLVWREEGEGRLYPLANKASSVLDVLRVALDAAQVEVLTDFAVQAITKHPDGYFAVKAEDGRELQARQVIVATGGSTGERLAGSFGLPFVEQRPVLGPLAVSAEAKRVTKRLDNIRVKATATLRRDGEPLRSEQGEVLFRAYGLSGIAVFDLSRDAQLGDEISLDLLPPEMTADAPAFLKERAALLLSRTCKDATNADILRGLVLPQVAQALAESARVTLDAPCNDSGLERLANALTDWRFPVEGIGDARQCQVKRGGVSVEALSASTLEAGDAPGLYVAGEAVDVDAACGGFNLHWAWASGLLAGHAAAQGTIAER